MRDGLKRRTAGVAWLLAGAAVCWTAGCATAPPVAEPAPQASRASGQIIRVNAPSGFVVAECAVLPSPGEEARVVRSNDVVGRVRFTPPVRFPYMTADVLEGQPAAGDWVVIDTPRDDADAE